MTIIAKCVTMKMRKIGTRIWTLSLTPRRFRRTRSPRIRSFERNRCACQLVGQEAEDLVDSRGDRGRDRQDVVDDQRASGDDAEPAAEQLRRHEVAAAPAGKELDDLAVAGGDDEDGRRDHQRQEDRQVGVGPERAEGLLRTVGRRREAVRPQARPRRGRRPGTPRGRSAGPSDRGPSRRGCVLIVCGQGLGRLLGAGGLSVWGRPSQCGARPMIAFRARSPPDGAGAPTRRERPREPMEMPRPPEVVREKVSRLGAGRLSCAVIFDRELGRRDPALLCPGAGGDAAARRLRARRPGPSVRVRRGGRGALEAGRRDFPGQVVSRRPEAPHDGNRRAPQAGDAPAPTLR